jgi:ribonuclease HI
VGRKPGVYENWEEASEQIKDVKGPKYKKFATRAEAEAFVASGGKITAATAAKKGDTEEKPAKKAKTSASEGPKLKADGLLKVWTDGAARGNGQKGAQAGVGVFFGVNDPRYVSSCAS